MADRRLLVAALFAALAACGSNPSAPAAPQAAACPLINNKVSVVITYTRDRTKAAPAWLFIAPGLVLIDDTIAAHPGPEMARVDEYTWTTGVLMIPNSNPMSHSATMLDLTLENANVATGVTVNGVQVRAVTTQRDVFGYFGVDECGRIFV